MESCHVGEQPADVQPSRFVRQSPDGYATAVAAPSPSLLRGIFFCSSRPSGWSGAIRSIFRQPEWFPAALHAARGSRKLPFKALSQQFGRLNLLPSGTGSSIKSRMRWRFCQRIERSVGWERPSAQDPRGILSQLVMRCSTSAMHPTAGGSLCYACGTLTAPSATSPPSTFLHLNASQEHAQRLAPAYT